jgi:glycosyltransferase involved in cell wall biosynthesis
MKLNIIHNVISIGPDSFGIGAVSMGSATSQYKMGHNPVVWCLDLPNVYTEAAEKYAFPPKDIIGFPQFGPKQLYFSPSLIRHASKQKTNGISLVHQHGIWGANSLATLLMARLNDVPTVISPHGSLSAWALNKSANKKSIAFYEKLNLKYASCLVATSELEINDFRDFKLSNPIAYIPNGTILPEDSIMGNKDIFYEKYRIPKSKRILLFLSRITSKKGLLMLLDAISMMKQEFSGWILIIAGNDEGGHSKEVKDMIRKHQLSNHVKIIGTQFHEWKQHAFAAAELFILPSLSEGAPMVILESLAAGLPVLTTKSSSWKDLITYKCGWWTDIGVDAVALSLREAVAMSSNELHEMGARGKELIRQKYVWSNISEMNIHLYLWLLKMADKPDFVLK